MSSIYRKGRDGYFYYQTYLYDYKTGKKSKKVFHSLSTKDRALAEKKKNILDKKYSRSGRNINFSRPIIILILICIFGLIYYLLNFRNNSDSITDIPPELTTAPEVELNIQNNSLSTNTFEEKKILKKADINSKNNSKVSSVKALNDLNKIPDYVIYRIEKSPGIFNQIKIYLTINKQVSNQGINSLCYSLKKEYSEFSNFVICVYLDDIIGTRLAKGDFKGIEAMQYKKSWIAMYSFNDVEGEYIDYEPAAYLNIK